MGINRLVFATSNLNKVRELKDILTQYQLSTELLSLQDFDRGLQTPEEDADSYEGNALIKARYYANHLQTPCLADDSGFEVEALKGRPGLHSARYGETSDPARQRQLLWQELKSTGNSNRHARFVCALAFVEPLTKTEMVFRGFVEGQVCQEKGHGGFGYDPLFIANGFSKSFAELSSQEKNEISHRAVASRKFIKFLLDSAS